ncbi:hypothetical protein Z948_3337 [Sulfitobacter donghicola DSW-25 = KCTC 12864 = JCM 14565]|nr:hypothetical protein Z948_3337 [Sulfitobacter donghicola DSW-25 = KCTC 12864 = JCM 14565]
MRANVCENSPRIFSSGCFMIMPVLGRLVYLKPTVAFLPS